MGEGVWVEEQSDIARVSLETVPGAVLDRRYRVRREVARGGMGAVLAVEHVYTGRRLALKLACGRAADLPLFNARLMREAQALELSRGPGVVDIVDAGLIEGEAFLALEMLEGRPLDGLLTARRRLTIEQAVGVVVGMCDALESVHRAGVVHRDLKPSNVFIATRGEAERTVLIDFGIARVPTQAEPAKLTLIGERPGTPDYMAPEQLLDESVDHRADLFALGLVLYECIVGEAPFPEREMLKAVLSGRSAPSLAAQPKLDPFLARMLSKDLARRPPSARALAEELLAITGLRRAPLRLLDGSAREAQESKRQFARAPFVAPLRVIDGIGTAHDGQTADLSEGGLLGMLAAPLEVGTKVMLRFGMPISGRVAVMPAVIRWVRTARHGHAIGFSFVDAPEEPLAEVRRYLLLLTEGTAA